MSAMTWRGMAYMVLWNQCLLMFFMLLPKLEHVLIIIAIWLGVCCHPKVHLHSDFAD